MQIPAVKVAPNIDFHLPIFSHALKSQYLWRSFFETTTIPKLD